MTRPLPVLETIGRLIKSEPRYIVQYYLPDRDMWYDYTIHEARAIAIYEAQRLSRSKQTPYLSWFGATNWAVRRELFSEKLKEKLFESLVLILPAMLLLLAGGITMFITWIAQG